MVEGLEYLLDVDLTLIVEKMEGLVNQKLPVPFIYVYQLTDSIRHPLSSDNIKENLKKYFAKNNYRENVIKGVYESK